MAGKTLTRADLSKAVQYRLGLSHVESASIVNSALAMIADTLVEGETVKLSSFGVFSVRDKAERIGRNPKTGEDIPIKARRVVTFKPGQKFKSRVENAKPED